MRTLDYDAFIRDKKKKYFSLKAALGYRRAQRNRPRGKREILIQMDKNRFEKKIELIGEREYRIN